MEVEPIAALDLKVLAGSHFPEHIDSTWYDEKDYLVTRFDEHIDGELELYVCSATILTRNTFLMKALMDGATVGGVALLSDARSIAPADVFDLLFVLGKESDFTWIPRRLTQLLSL